MPFFDFHCHPGLKPQFSDPDGKVTPWEFINARLSLARDIRLRINKLFNEVLNSQSNLSQLIEADVKLIGLILHAPEQKIGEALGSKKIVNKGSVDLIDKDQLAYLTTGIHSFELINEELRWLKEAPPAPGKKLKVLDNTADFNEAEANTVFGGIIIEGLHCFFDDPAAPDAKAIHLDNFNQFTNNNTVVAINICHMQQNPFCNHAHGIQFFNPPFFYPREKGITPWGSEMIELMISKKILVDIKHMSLKSRWELYTWFKDPNDETKFIQPLICTHAGTTGLSVADRAKFLLTPPVDMGDVYEVSYLKPQSRHNSSAYHNCSSINLYDEDIANIFLSGGIIGLSFDQRILGFADENLLPGVNIPHDLEYISKQEAGFFFGGGDPAGLHAWPDDTGVWAGQDFDDIDPSLYIETHRRFLVNNIIHILWVANTNPLIGLTKAAKQICIGTDFDGLINAIDCCKQTTGLSQLKRDIREDIEEGIAALGAGAFDTTQFLDDLFYNNGKNFMIERIRLMKG
jgi:microsomal dipeptidase-like Zn-dependent dipeptidase